MATVWVVGKLEAVDCEGTNKILMSAIYADELSALKDLRTIYDAWYRISLRNSRPWYKCYFFRGCKYDIFEVKVRTFE